jgi:hypothetical protein
MRGLYDYRIFHNTVHKHLSGVLSCSVRITCCLRIKTVRYTWKSKRKLWLVNMAEKRNSHTNFRWKFPISRTQGQTWPLHKAYY